MFKASQHTLRGGIKKKEEGQTGRHDCVGELVWVLCWMSSCMVFVLGFGCVLLGGVDRRGVLSSGGSC